VNSKWLEQWNTNLKYCHVTGVPWRIITGSGLDDWIYWHFFTITISSQSMTLHDSLHSLLDYERLLFHCDEWRSSTHTLNSFWMNYDSFITSRRPQYKSPCQTVSLLFCSLSRQSVFSDLLPSNNSFVVIRCSGNLCLPKRCLANVHIPS
jgi:hypothetical protein